MNINQLDALRAAEEEREEADKRRAGWRARRTTVPDEDGGGEAEIGFSRGVFVTLLIQFNKERVIRLQRL